MKLNNPARAAIRELHRKGVQQVQLAKIYGVSVSTIKLVLHPELEQKNRERNRIRQRVIRNSKRVNKTKKIEESKDATSNN